MEEKVGRFAPTPSGEMHLGNLYCAMVSYLAARSDGGKFLLRIEDNDTPRCRREYEEEIIECLSEFGFTWDGEIIRQSQRSSIYSAALEKIASSTYPCFCTREEVLRMDAPHLGDTQRLYSGRCRSLSQEEAARKTAELGEKGRQPAIRLKVPNETIEFNDAVFGNVRENLAEECGDFVLRRSDGIWGYQLTSTVDDMLQGVNMVVRGRDILFSTPRQIYLRSLLGGGKVEYAHIPLMLGTDGSRLAKRDKASGIRALLKKYSPEEILGKLAYSAGILPEYKPSTLESLIPVFHMENIGKEDFAVQGL